MSRMRTFILDGQAYHNNKVALKRLFLKHGFRFNFRRPQFTWDGVNGEIFAVFVKDAEGVTKTGTFDFNIKEVDIEKEIIGSFVELGAKEKVLHKLKAHVENCPVSAIWLPNQSIEDSAKSFDDACVRWAIWNERSLDRKTAKFFFDKMEEERRKQYGKGFSTEINTILMSHIPLFTELGDYM